MSIWWEKTSVNDTLPSYARATDISVCLPMHIQGLCQRQKPWKKLQDDRMNRQTDTLTNILTTVFACQIFVSMFVSLYVCLFVLKFFPRFLSLAQTLNVHR